MGFITETASGVGNVAARILLANDIHCLEGTNGANCTADITAFVAAANRDRWNWLINAGDTFDQPTGAGTFDQQKAKYDLIKNGIVTRDPVDNNITPHIVAFGNHDRWDYDAMMTYLGMPSRYYSTTIDTASFQIRVIVLWSQGKNGDGVQGDYGLGTTQYDWLEDELIAAAGANQKVIIVSHVPIFDSASKGWYFKYRGHDDTVAGDYNATMDQHVDSPKVLNLLQQYTSRIIVCLNGHMHRYGPAEDLGVRFESLLAIAGNYYSGGPGRPWFGENQGYGELIIFADASYKLNKKRF